MYGAQGNLGQMYVRWQTVAHFPLGACLSLKVTYLQGTENVIPFLGAFLTLKNTY
jgi:hypothetical protein